jgi:fibrillarin-like rRNA methylase
MAFCEILTKYESHTTTYGTDKNTTHSYGHVYDIVFNNYKDTCNNLLEIGFDSGASLQAYSDYFTNTMIYGIDIKDTSMPFIKSNPRITTFIGDATKPETINTFNKTFDIIIEDASHLPEHQLQHFIDYSPFLNKGGVYIIEDINQDYFDKLKGAFETIALQNGFTFSVVDLRFIKNRFDDILFVFKKL